MWRRSGLSAWCSPECYGQRSVFTVRAAESRNRGADIPGAAVEGRRMANAVRKRKSDIPHATRLEVAQRDKSCRWCTAPRGLHIHHVLYRSQGGTHDASNLVVLCHECHAHAHAVGPRARELLLGVIWLTYAGQRLTVPQLARMLQRSDDLHIR